MYFRDNMKVMVNNIEGFNEDTRYEVYALEEISHPDAESANKEICVLLNDEDSRFVWVRLSDTYLK